MIVLDKCRKEYDSGAREYNYEFIEDFPNLYMEGKCPKFNSGKTFIAEISLIMYFNCHCTN